MPRPQYPLEALRKLRDERAEALAQRLALQIARTGRVESKLRECERARREHQQRTSETLQSEQRRLVAGAGNGADLGRIADFELAARAQRQLLERAEAEARQALAVERAEEQKIREEQALREAEAKLVRNHEAGFHEQRASQAERAEEEAALEQWNARRR